MSWRKRLSTEKVTIIILKRKMFHEVSSGVEERLNSLGNNKPDLTEAPPIHQKRLVTFFNHYVLTTVDFVNTFSESCANKLFLFDQKISKIEAELRLLETKINSIPELEDAKDVNVSLPPPQQLDAEIPEEKIEDEMQNTTPVPEPSNHPDISKYLRMVQVGVPVEGVKLKMKQENVDPELLRL